MSNERTSATAGSNEEAAPLEQLRTADFDRYLQVLVAPAAHREALLSLYMLNLELARVADHVREPMAGLIRLQWWREALERLAAEVEPTHATLALLKRARLRDRLSGASLQALVDARETELDTTPLTRVDDVEAHARATAGALNGLTARLLGANDQVQAAAGAAGTAYGLLGIVRAVPFVLRRPQPLLPAGLVAEHGLDRAHLGSGTDELQALRPVLRALVDRADARLSSLAISQPRMAAAAFVPAVLARQDLRRLRAADLDLSDGRLAERPPWTTLRCLLAAGLGRFG